MFEQLKEVSKKISDAKLNSAKEGITLEAALKEVFNK